MRQVELVMENCSSDVSRSGLAFGHPYSRERVTQSQEDTEIRVPITAWDLPGVHVVLEIISMLS